MCWIVPWNVLSLMCSAVFLARLLLLTFFSSHWSIIINTPPSIFMLYFSYCLLRWTLLFEYIEHECGRKNMQCNVSLLAEKTHNIRRTNCRRFSIQLLRLAPRTTIYLFSGYTQHSVEQPKGCNICFLLFCCVLFISEFDLIWLGLVYKPCCVFFLGWFACLQAGISRRSRQNCCQFNGISNSVKLKRKRANVAFILYHHHITTTITQFCQGWRKIYTPEPIKLIEPH